MDREVIFWLVLLAIGATAMIAALAAARRVGREYVSWMREEVE